MGRGKVGARHAAYQGGARRRLSRFRRGSILAVAITAWLLMLAGVEAEELEAEAMQAEVQQQDTAAAGVAGANQPADTDPNTIPPAAAQNGEDLGAAVEDAATTIQELVNAFAGILPRLMVAIALLFAAGLITAILRRLLRRALANWERADATTALVAMAVWLIAISAALSVIVGDPRTLLGSVGLVGLALSWALQAPIESFTGWLLNSFRGYYRVGDRIVVGEVVGDVYRIDVLTTTVWGIGSPEKPVQGAQPTGSLITFPNSEILRASVVNHTRDFPYVWDEITVQISEESDVDYAHAVLLAAAERVLGEEMTARAEQYRSILARSRLAMDVSDRPTLFFSLAESWVDVTIRYIVHARQRRGVASALVMEVQRELARPEHGTRLRSGYPRMELGRVRTDAGE
jgi:small conductance mechanosensitive channel